MIWIKAFLIVALLVFIVALMLMATKAVFDILLQKKKPKIKFHSTFQPMPDVSVTMRGFEIKVIPTKAITKGKALMYLNPDDYEDYKKKLSEE